MKIWQFNHRSLQSLIVIPFVWLIIFSVGITGYYSFQNSISSIDILTNRLMQEVSNRIQLHVRQYLNNPLILTELDTHFFENGNLGFSDIADIEKTFLRQLEQFPVKGVFLGDEKGRGVAVFPQGEGSYQSRVIVDPPKRLFFNLDANGNHLEQVKETVWDPRSRPWYKGAVNSHGSLWSPIYTFTDGMLGITASQSYTSTSNSLSGVIGVDLDLSFISGFLEKLEISRTGEAFIFERRGWLVASSLRTPLSQKSRDGLSLERVRVEDSPVTMIRQAIHQAQDRFGSLDALTKTKQISFDTKNGPQYVQFSPLIDDRGLDWVLAVTAFEEDFRAQITANMHNTILITVATLTVSILLGIWISRKILRPVKAISLASKKIADGDYHQKIVVPSDIELGTLAGSFNMMSSHLLKSFADLEKVNVSLEETVAKRTVALSASENRFRLITQSVHDAIISITSEGRVVFWNAAAQVIFGYADTEILDKPLTMIMPERYRKGHERGLLNFEEGSFTLEGKTVELHGINKKGEEFPLELTLASWQEEGERYYSAVIRDITERKKSEEKIYHQANFDVLTDLPNRNYFMHLFSSSLSLSQRLDKPLALMFIDLDRFKWVNDNLGHAAGDQLLIDVAQRLKICLRESDTVARLGGDEFTVILPDFEDKKGVLEVADKILKQLSTVFILENQETYISGSIGITLFPEDGTEVESLLKNADHAMYVAKKSGRNAYWLFETPPELKEATL